MIPRFYPILDTGLLRRRGLDVVDAAREILDAGARILQLRHKDFFSREVFDDAERIADLCRRAGAQFILNDRADIAALLGAGVHLGQEDLREADLNAIAASGTRLGLSTHGYFEMLTALHFRPSYIACGAVFATTTKSMPTAPQGLARLARYVKLLDGVVWDASKDPKAYADGFKIKA